MKIDYENIPVKVEKQFKGGEGETVMRAFADDMGRMMKLCLKPGCSIGFHTHEATARSFTLSADARAASMTTRWRSFPPATYTTVRKATVIP